MTSIAPSLLEDLVTQSRELYSLPSVAVQVLELTNHPKIDAARLKACIELDPALTTKILRVVNSSLFGLTRQVSDLNQALALLGTQPLKLLVLGFSLPDALFTDVSGDVLTRFWKHTLTRAVAAREISQQFWNIPGDEAFIAGLLADLGILVLMQGLGDEYTAFYRRVIDAGVDLAAVERNAMGFDHRQLTSQLLSHWGLPTSLVEAVKASGDREEPENASEREKALPQVLHLAELLSAMLADVRPEVLTDLLSAGAEYQRFDAQKLDPLVAQLQERVEQLADVFSLQLPEGRRYADVLTHAHQQLVQTAAAAAGDAVRARLETLNARIDSFQLQDEVRTLAAAVADRHAKKGFNQRRGGSANRMRPNEMPTSGKHGMPTPASRAHHVEPMKPAPSATKFDEHENWEHPSLLAELVAAVFACRQARCALSLLLVEVDRFEQVQADLGPLGTYGIEHQIQGACDRIDLPGANVLQLLEQRFALILPDCDRRGAVEAGNQLLRELRSAADGEEGRTFTVSIGASTVALPPRNFPPVDLVTSAERCLNGAKLSGGNGLKSIEMY
jgi:HD-like signal output (HDOD) protein/GGDEF domain-containing protein